MFVLTCEYISKTTVVDNVNGALVSVTRFCLPMLCMALILQKEKEIVSVVVSRSKEGLGSGIAVV